MMRLRFPKLLAVAVGTVLTLGLSATAAGARPAAQDDTVRELCGKGYEIVNRHDLQEVGTQAVQATVFLATHVQDRGACVVTLRTTPGPAHPTSAYAQSGDTPRTTDAGTFRHYAGPVRLTADDGCLRWGGGYRTAQWNGQDPLTKTMRSSCPSTG